jgi:hypothetical protein
MAKPAGGKNSADAKNSAADTETLLPKLANNSNQPASDFDGPAQLKNGWHYGDGASLDPDNLRRIAEIFIHNFPYALPLPQIVPTQDGNLSVEWNTEGMPSIGMPSIDAGISNKIASFQAFGLNSADDLTEKDFDLPAPNMIGQFFECLAKHTKQTQQFFSGAYRLKTADSAQSAAIHRPQTYPREKFRKRAALWQGAASAREKPFSPFWGPA